MPRMKSLATGNVLTNVEAAKKFRERSDLPDTYKAMDDNNMLNAIARDFSDQYQIIPDEPPARQSNPLAYSKEEIMGDVAQGGTGYIKAPAKVAANLGTSIGNQVYQVVSSIPDLVKLPFDKSQARMRYDMVSGVRRGMSPDDPNYQAVLAEEGQAREAAAIPTVPEIWNALTDEYKSRYGSMEGLSRAIIEDPAAILADIGTVVTGLGAGAKGVQMVSKGAAAAKAAQAASTLNKVGSALDPINIAASGVKSVIPAREALAQTMYKGALNMAFRDPKRTESVVNTGLRQGAVISKNDESTKLNPVRRLLGDEPVVPTPERLQQEVNRLTSTVNAMVADAQKRGVSLNTQDVISRVEKELVDMRKTMSGGAQSDQIFNKLDTWLSDNNLVAKDQAGNVIRDSAGRPAQYLPMNPEQALDLRRALTKELEQPLNRMAVSSPMADYQLRSVVRGDELLRRNIAQELGKIDPMLAEIGMQQRDLIDLSNAIEGLRGKKSGAMDARDLYAARGAVSGANKIYNITTLAARMLQLPGVLSSLAIKLHNNGIKPNTRLQNLVRQAGFNLARFNQAVETGEAKNLDLLDQGVSLQKGTKIDVMKAMENPFTGTVPPPSRQAPAKTQPPPERNPYK